MASQTPDQDRHGLPAAPIDRLTAPFERFMHVSASGGIVLLVCTVFALAAANSPWSEAYLGIWLGPDPISTRLRDALLQSAAGR